MAGTQKIAASISDAEIEILRQLWEEAPLSAQEIIERLERENEEGVHPKTVKTLINRLLKKGALHYVEKHRKYYYSPAIEQDDFYAQRASSFLDRYFDGEIIPLLSFFSRHKKLGEKDLAELKRLIADLEEESDED